MTTFTPFQIASETHIGLVALKVADLENMTNFYTQVIGLHILSQTTTQTSLGVLDGQPLLILEKIDHPLPLTRRTGLYHVAFLVPNRGALGEALRHYLTIDAPLVGASDHGYSEALYLTDPEGNGIEVYRDKPMSEWDIRENGEIHGITIEMDAQGVVAAATKEWQGFSEETIIGHVHLKVADLEKTETFFTDVLGFALKSNFGRQAKFFAAGTYHHHIGSNIWMGEHVPAMQEHDLGLSYFSFVVPSRQELERLRTQLTEKNIPYQHEKTALWLVDPNGITIKIDVKN